MVNLSSLFLAGALALQQATAIQFNVSVGRNGLSFEPNEIRASRDDVIEFRFWARNHSVVAGRFSEACVPAASRVGFWSGFMPTAVDTINPQVFRVRINNSDPIVFYCSQNNGQHCKNGMYGIINPTLGGVSTLAGYGELAKQAGNATSPQVAPYGGQFFANPNTVPPQTAATTVTVFSGSPTAGANGASSAATDSSATPTQSGSSESASSNSGPVAVGGGPFMGLVVAGAAAVLFV